VRQSLEIQEYVFKGDKTKHGDFPWHAGIHELELKTGTYKYICGGTLISAKVVISAAHCFCQENKHRKIKLKEFSMMRVAVGKHYRDIYDPADVASQIKDVSSRFTRT